jgi:Na+/proline symporter
VSPVLLAQGVSLPRVAEPTVVAGVVLYFLAVLLIGARASQGIRGASDFYLAGRALGPVALSISAVAATLSGFTFIGGPGLLYTVGLGALFILLPAGVTNSVGAWVLAKRMRVLAELRPVLTLPEAIGVRYRSRGAHALAAISVLVAVLGYMATNVLALGWVLEAILGTPLWLGIWIGAGVTLLYTAGGGIRAAIHTDLLQGGVMAVASGAVFLFAIDPLGRGLGGLSEAILAQDPGFLRPWGHLDPRAALSFFFVFSLGVLGQPHVLNKFFMLRNPQDFRWYPLLSALALCLTVLLFFGVGIAVKGGVILGELPAPTHPDRTTPLFLLERTPRLLAAVVFAGVVAAIMSTLNGFMNVGAAALAHDLPVAMGSRVVDPVRRGRQATVAITLLAAGLAQVSTDLVAFLGIFGWGLFASTLVPSLALGLNWTGATRAGALASMSVGLGGTLILEAAARWGWISLPTGVTLSGLTLLGSFLAFLGVSWWTRDQAAGDLDPDLRVLLEGG